MQQFCNIIVFVEKQMVETVESLFLDYGALCVTSSSNDSTQVIENDAQASPLWHNVKLIAMFNDTFDFKPLVEQLSPYTSQKIECIPIKNKNWQTAWMDHYKPIKIADQFWICPSWQQAPQLDATIVKIDPGMAFGTGIHESTRLCLSWINEIDLANLKVLDYGCGSGILGIASVALGAEHAYCVDIDPKALSVSRDNAKLNNVSGQIKLALPNELNENYKADLVVANILANTIIDLKATLINHMQTNGKLLLAGILEDQVELVKSNFTNFNWRIKKMNRWIAMIGNIQPGY